MEILSPNAATALPPITVHPHSSDPTPPADASSKSNATAIGGGEPLIKMKKKKKKPYIELPENPQPSNNNSFSSSSCCTSSSSSSHGSLRAGLRVSNNRRNPRILIGSARQKENDVVDSLALPLGMSIAAFVAQVLERKDAAGEIMSVDHLSKICTMAVAESLDNVFGNKFDGFVRNFEKSFQSTLMTLRLINESSQNNGKQKNHLSNVLSADNREINSTSNSGISDFQSKAILDNNSTEERSFEEIHENVQTNISHRELVLHNIETNQQLSQVSSNTLNSGHSGVNQFMLNTMEKSIIEQARSNDLKAFEIGLLMKKMHLKEAQLSLSSESNLLERFKLSMGISKASFRAEKFKTELEETRHAELLKKCADCLVAGLLVMLACIAYGTYVYSHERITEATESCIPSKDSSAWWMPKPMSAFNSGLQILKCQVQVISRMLFGVLMIGTIAYLLLQRSSSSKQTMPVTFILLLLGVACGFAGKLCIDTLGGSGYHWLFYWELLCLLHFFSNVCTSALFFILYGPINVMERRSKGGKLFPYWIRRFIYYSTTLMIMPMCCGFIPFAGFGEWKDHFYLLLEELFVPMRIE